MANSSPNIIFFAMTVAKGLDSSGVPWSACCQLHPSYKLLSKSFCDDGPADLHGVAKINRQLLLRRDDLPARSCWRTAHAVSLEGPRRSIEAHSRGTRPTGRSQPWLALALAAPTARPSCSSSRPW